MFIQNKYYIWYFSIVNRALSENRSKKYGYLERHHIIPKSMGGENRVSNYVLLTEKEHYVAHRLLLKMVFQSDHIKKMKSALVMMVNSKKKSRRFSSRDYIMVNKFNREKTHSIEAKMKISAARKGTTFTEETRRRLSEANRSSYKFISPNGEILHTVNLKEFCLKNDLNYTLMTRLSKGTYISTKYKGWCVYKETEI